MPSRALLALLAVSGLFALSGASCPRVIEQYRAPTPRVLSEQPALAEVTELINQNSRRVGSLYSTQARLTGPGLPTLRASVAMERPQRIRLRAETALTGPEVDLGSNDEQFWLWVARNQPPAVLVCRHDEFAGSPAAQALPVDASWLIEAIGLPTFEPHEHHEGPSPVGQGRLEIRTRRATANGPIQRVVLVDAAQGWVLEQHLYDATGRLLASAISRQHRRDPLYDVVLPRQVDIQWPSAQLSLRLHLDDVQLNYLGGDPAQLWAKPVYPGWPELDLARPPQISAVR